MAEKLEEKESLDLNVILRPAVQKPDPEATKVQCYFCGSESDLIWCGLPRGQCRSGAYVCYECRGKF
jgi:hypothetical protein